MSGNAACSLSQSGRFDFDTVLDRDNLSTLKWEFEIARTGDATLLSFGTADMDFRSPPAVIEALRRTADAGHFGYPLKRPTYFDAVIGYLDRHFGWKVDRSWIESGAGIYPSMHPIITELSEPGDEIIFQPPVHHIFPEIIRANGRVPVANPLIKNKGDYAMDFADLESKITSKTKLLLLCSPHNPVGRVWTMDELRRLERICADRKLIVVVDEVYSGLLYEGVTFTPFATVSPWASMNSYSLISASKPYNLTGLKHSIVIAANPELRANYVEGLGRTNSGYGGSTFGFAATEAALRDGDDWNRCLMGYISSNFEYLRDELQRHLPEVELTMPQAAYFAWIDLTTLGASRERYQPLIDNVARLVVTYGEPLGSGGQCHIRLNIATPRSTLSTGLNRLLSVLVPLADRPYLRGNGR